LLVTTPLASRTIVGNTTIQFQWKDVNLYDLQIYVKHKLFVKESAFQ